MSDTPFGALAWIDGVQSIQAAKARQTVYDLSRSPCQSLPARPSYWFMINHRSADAGVSAGFFALRAIGRASPGDTIEKLLLYRNGGWVTETGTTLGSNAPNVSGDRLTVREFIKLHNDAAAEGQSSDQRLSDLNSRLGDTWHAKPAQDQQSSWNYRGVYSSPRHLRESDGEGAQYYWAALIRFLPTDSFSSKVPVIFNLTRFIDNNYVNRLWISIAAPNLEFPAGETEIRIDGACTGQAELANGRRKESDLPPAQ
jgi:hypothetical protein